MANKMTQAQRKEVIEKGVALKANETLRIDANGTDELRDIWKEINAKRKTLRKFPCSVSHEQNAIRA